MLQKLWLGTPLQPSLDLLAFRKQLDELLTHEDPEKTSSGLLAALPSLQKTLEAEKRLWDGVPGDSSHSSDDSGLVNAILLGQRRYTNINVPLLAIFANPHKLHDLSDYDATGRAALAKSVQDRTATAVNALKTGIPAAHVVVIPNADHFVYVSNEAEVVREINAFLTTLVAPAVPHTP